MKYSSIITAITLIAIAMLGFSFFNGQRAQKIGGVVSVPASPSASPVPLRVSANTLPAPHQGIPSPLIAFVGPRENIPKDAPTAYGFWSLAMPVSNVLSRSGQPLMSEFTWLKENGWKGVVDLRITGDHSEEADDAKLPGFNKLGFNYLHLEIADGHPPTDAQAQDFLTFVNNPANQPTHIHCRGGYGRTGTMTALYRYSVQGWPLDQAIAESRAFKGGISDAQKKWLEEWAKNHPAGSFKP